MRRIAIIFFLFVALPALAYDPEKGRCSADGEKTLSDCNSGQKCVWHYTRTENGKKAGSWCYDTREQAQRAAENARKLCETIARWDKTTCQTTYSAPYCRACGNKGEAKGCEAAELAGLEPGEILFEAARGAQDYGTRLPVWERAFPGSTLPGSSSGGPYATVGSVVSGYAAAMKHAMQKQKQLTCLVDNGANRTIDDVGNEIRRNFDEFNAAVGAMKEAESRLPKQETITGYNDAPITGWTIDGSKTGRWSGTTSDGTKVEEWYVYGQRDGVVRLAYPDGSRSEIPYRYGKREGWHKRFTSGGALWEEVEYDNGAPTDKVRIFSADGSGRKVMVRVPRPDNHYEEFVYWPNGSLRSRTTYTRIRPHGELVTLMDGISEGYYEASRDQTGPTRWLIDYRIVRGRPDGPGYAIGVFSAKYLSRDGRVLFKKFDDMPTSEIDEDRRLPE